MARGARNPSRRPRIQVSIKNIPGDPSLLLSKTGHLSPTQLAWAAASFILIAAIGLGWTIITTSRHTPVGFGILALALATTALILKMHQTKDSLSQDESQGVHIAKHISQSPHGWGNTHTLWWRRSSIYRRLLKNFWQLLNSAWRDVNLDSARGSVQRILRMAYQKKELLEEIEAAEAATTTLIQHLNSLEEHRQLKDVLHYSSSGAELYSLGIQIHNQLIRDSLSQLEKLATQLEASQGAAENYLAAIGTKRKLSELALCLSPEQEFDLRLEAAQENT